MDVLDRSADPTNPGNDSTPGETGVEFGGGRPTWRGVARPNHADCACGRRCPGDATNPRRRRHPWCDAPSGKSRGDFAGARSVDRAAPARAYFRVGGPPGGMAAATMITTRLSSVTTSSAAPSIWPRVGPIAGKDSGSVAAVRGRVAQQPLDDHRVLPIAVEASISPTRRTHIWLPLSSFA